MIAKRFMLFYLLLPAAVKSQSLQPVVPGEQYAQISFIPEKSNNDEARLENQWQGFCQKFGKSILLQAEQPGFVASFTCIPAGLAIPPSNAYSWRIRLIEQKRFLNLELSFGKGEKEHLVHSFRFRLEGDVLAKLQANKVQQILSRMLVESLPTGWVYLHNEADSDLALPSPGPPLSLPHDINVYDLFFKEDANVWLPRLRARLKPSAVKIETRKSKMQSYQIVESYLPLRKGQAYWVQNNAGVGKRQGDFNSLMSKNMEGFSLIGLLDRLIFESMESNFAGIRYGHSFLKGSSIITDVQLLATLVEMRSGPLAGLRWYYDFTPKLERDGEGGSEIFQLRRASLGWAFGWDTSPPLQALVSQINIQPKIGLLDLKSRFIVTDSEGELNYLSFEARNVYDLALEVGLEKESIRYRSRLWGSINTAKFGQSNQDAVAVASQKLGLDVYFDLMEGRGSWDMKLLLFGMSESMNLQKNPSKVLNSDGKGLYDISFNLLFLGGGFTISW
ncbi:MAG: hypothetical protein M3Q07_23940 [Pseudobdellovibrionaceae bacterium]|nr:hypothetical protein [Pseudobdellovibrionaceae bacterium]